ATVFVLDRSLLMGDPMCPGTGITLGVLFGVIAYLAHLREGKRKRKMTEEGGLLTGRKAIEEANDTT
ncbi:MAG: hypothetical protein ACC651_17220, partial [Candidatus Scalindua sp.]